MTDLDHTHDPAARSWVASAATGDFPLQNLPFAVFGRTGAAAPDRIGVAIGDQVLDLAMARSAGAWADAGELAQQAIAACDRPALNGLLELGPQAWRALRHALFDGLRQGAPQRTALETCLTPQAGCHFGLPAVIGDYTDFYTSIDHATTIGRLFRPDAPLTPNFQWVPCAYHGRVSTLVMSGAPVYRPAGQRLPAGSSAPTFGPCERLDYELELGVLIGTGNPRGRPIPVDEAASHLFGVCLLNDWSARDIQSWESAPLGPFQAKNFCTTLSPWIVTMDALAPYRVAWQRPADHPQPLPYLESAAVRAAGALDIRLQVHLATAAQRAAGIAPHRVAATSFRHQYWSLAQMVAHHTVGGCALRPGDLIGSGTISGPGPGEAGALIETTLGGRQPVVLEGGEERRFLCDGDQVTLTGRCEREGFVSLGFGAATGVVEPAPGP